MSQASALPVSRVVEIKGGPFTIEQVAQIAGLLNVHLNPEASLVLPRASDDEPREIVLTQLPVRECEHTTLAVCENLRAGVIRGRLIPDDLVASQQRAWWEQDVDTCVNDDQLDMLLAFRLGLMPVSGWRAEELREQSDLIVVASGLSPHGHERESNIHLLPWVLPAGR